VLLLLALLLKDSFLPSLLALAATLLLSFSLYQMIPAGCSFKNSALYGLHIVSTGSSRAKITLQDAEFDITARSAPNATAVSIVDGDLKIANATFNIASAETNYLHFKGRGNRTLSHQPAALYSAQVPRDWRISGPKLVDSWSAAPEGFLALKHPRFEKLQQARRFPSGLPWTLKFCGLEAGRLEASAGQAAVKCNALPNQTGMPESCSMHGYRQCRFGR
jgi:hypothetical protein